MSNLIKFWKKMSFWTKLKTYIAGITTLIEGGLLMGDSDHIYKAVVFGLGLIGLTIAHFAEDKNNNGIVDLLEDDAPDETPKQP